MAKHADCSDATIPTKTRKVRTPKPAKTRAEYLREFDALPEWARCDQATVAAVKGCSEAKLERDRWAGGGIPFVREGGRTVTDKNGKQMIVAARIFYIKRDVLADLAAAQPMRHTSDHPA